MCANKSVQVETLVCGNADNVVHDVSWAPYMGRSYHLIAVACKDKSVCYATMVAHTLPYYLGVLAC